MSYAASQIVHDPDGHQAELDVLRGIAAADAGLSISREKAAMVFARVSKRVRQLGLPDIQSYCRLVEDGANTQERRTLIGLLTTNVTRFFREPHHFDFLKREVLPPLVSHARGGGRVRIWSAGCSTGEEPYSIAMTVLDLMPEAGQCDLRILATDIDPSVLRTARNGRYPEEALSSLPDSCRETYTRAPADGTTGYREVTGELREMVVFRELNLMNTWPMRGTFDVIFCRNVVIYFDRPTQNALWPRFAEACAPQGYLILGHSERLDTKRHPQFQALEATTYQRSAINPDHSNGGRANGAT